MTEGKRTPNIRRSKLERRYYKDELALEKRHENRRIEARRTKSLCTKCKKEIDKNWIKLLCENCYDAL